MPRRFLPLIFLLVLVLSQKAYSASTPASTTTASKPTNAQIARTTHEHILRVAELSISLRNHEAEFRDVDPKLLREYILEVHDRHRLDNAVNLDNAPKEQLFFTNAIMNNHGTDFSRLSDADQAIFQQLKNRSQNKSYELIRAFFIKKGLLTADQNHEDVPIIAKIMRIEKIANQVDLGRSEAAAKEFGRSMWPAPVYFEKIEGDSEAARMAAFLDKSYKKASDIRHARFVKNPAEFRLYSHTHILRVALLGLALQAAFPEFHDVDRQILQEFLLRHDLAKVNQSQDFMIKFNITNEKTMAASLYDNYAIDFSSLPPELKAHTDAIVNRLNSIDRAVAKQFFRSKGLLEPNQALEDNP